MLDQARSRRLLMPPRPAQGPAPGRLRRSLQPMWWHLTGAGLLALVLTGGVAVLSNRDGETARHAATGSAQRATAAEPSSAPGPAKNETRAAPANPALAPGTVRSTATPAPAGAAVALPQATGAMAAAAKPDGGALAFVRPPAAPSGPDAPPAAGEAPPAPKQQPASEPGKRNAVSAPADAPLECLPRALRTALNEVSSRYGPITVVSTKHLNTRNHAPGSARHRLHESCKAVDFRVAPQRVARVKAYLRSLDDIAGAESYSGGIVHIDVTENRRAARGRRRSAAADE